METQSEEISIAEMITKYARLFWHWSWLLILITTVSGGVAYYLSSLQTPVYQASALTMINVSTNSQDPYTSVYLADTLGQTYLRIMTSRTVLDSVAQRLGLEILTTSLNVKLVPNSQLITITATNPDPERAALIANTVVTVFNEQIQADLAARNEESKQNLKDQMDVFAQQIQTTSANLAVLTQEIENNNTILTSLLQPDIVNRTQEELDQRNSLIQQTQSILQSKASQQAQLQLDFQNNQHSYDILMESYDSVRWAELQSTSGVLLKDPAIPADEPFQPQPVRNGLLGGMVVLLLSGGVIFLIDYLDDTFKIPEDVFRVLGLPVIGMIGEMEPGKNGSGKVYVGENPRSPVAEAYRVLRTNLEFGSVDQPLHTLLVTSVGPEEGKTTIAVNLAVIIAQGGKRVMVVDGDLHRPTVHRQLHIQNRTGLSDLFLGKVTDVAQLCTWGETRMWAVPSGPLPPNPTDLLGSEKFTQILNKFKENVDMVILDSAPSIVSDPIIISTKVDGVLLVIKPGSTKIGAAQVLMEQFQRSGARIVGVVLNPISRKRGNFGSKYEYYSKYYQSSSKSEGYYSYEGDKDRKKRITLRKRKKDNGTGESALSR